MKHGACVDDDNDGETDGSTQGPLAPERISRMGKPMIAKGGGRSFLGEFFFFFFWVQIACLR